MKSLIITCLVCFSVSLFAQSTATTGFVEHWTKIYQLDDNQQKKAQAIEVRRQNQLAEIASLKAADPKLYRQKREAIHKGAKAGLKFILRSDQRELFKQQEKELRVKRANKMKELKGTATPDQMQDALIDVNATF
ncbi:MAG: hypothetical protein KA101_04285 [Saprospiraceae bacterium]|nr:hypothetical protein [Saprospiraceae bacterium]